jgi:hypothetical protein
MKQYKDMVKRTGGDVNKLGQELEKVKNNKIKIKIDDQAVKATQELLKKLKTQITIPVNVKYNGVQGGQETPAQLRAMKIESFITQQHIQSSEAKIDRNSGKVYAYNQSTYKRLVNALKGIVEKKYIIKKFAKGGFLEDGLFTMNHNEIAGRFDSGKSVVANNEQISDGFAKSVTATLAPAIYSAVKQAMNETSNNRDNEVKVYLDGRQIAENSVKHIRNMNRSRNANVFA